MTAKSPLQEAINRLVESTPAAAALPARAPADPLPAKRGAGVPGIARGAGAGGGYVSPFTEHSAATRLYYPERIVATTEGIFSLRVRPLRQITLTDAEGRPRVDNFAPPS